MFYVKHLRGYYIGSHYVEKVIGIRIPKNYLYLMKSKELLAYIIKELTPEY